jgi:hypothetical protein
MPVHEPPRKTAAPDDGPGWLTREQAAAYVGMSVVAFTRRVASGVLLAPSDYLGPRCLRWDRLALDAHMLGQPAPGPDAQEIAERVAARIRAGGSRKRRKPVVQDSASPETDATRPTLPRAG